MKSGNEGLPSSADANPAARRRRGRPRHETPSQDYLKRRREIVNVAVNVFKLKGYDAGSLDDVAAELGLRKASLYYYVGSKAELLYLVFDLAISAALEDMEQIVASAPPPERLSKLLRHQIATVASDPSLFAVFFDQRPRLDPGYEEEIRAKERRYLQLFVDAVEEAIANGTLKAHNPRHAAQLLLGMANWTYKWFDSRRDTIEELGDTAVGLIFDCSDPSRSPIQE